MSKKQSTLSMVKTMKDRISSLGYVNWEKEGEKATKEFLSQRNGYHPLKVGVFYLSKHYL